MERVGQVRYFSFRSRFLYSASGTDRDLDIGLCFLYPRRNRLCG